MCECDASLCHGLFVKLERHHKRPAAEPHNSFNINTLCLSMTVYIGFALIALYLLKHLLTLCIWQFNFL